MITHGYLRLITGPAPSSKYAVRPFPIEHNPPLRILMDVAILNPMGLRYRHFVCRKDPANNTRACHDQQPVAATVPHRGNR
jgi:phosphoribosyl-dephospho-CoA transferase